MSLLELALSGQAFATPDGRHNVLVRGPSSDIIVVCGRVDRVHGASGTPRVGMEIVPMTGKQRVLATVAHAEPDRVPVDFAATSEVLDRLYRELDCTHEGLLERFGADFRRVNPRYVGPAIDRPVSELFISPFVSENADGTLVDVWGRTY